MADANDMATPVTRGELREELGQLERRFDEKLDLWGGALLARIESSEQRMLARIESSEQRLARLEQRIERSQQEVLAELARHTAAIYEAISKDLSVVDEKYADLPGRVRRLEAARDLEGR